MRNVLCLRWPLRNPVRLERPRAELCVLLPWLAGTYKAAERILTSPTHAEVDVAGRKLVNLCSNNVGDPTD